MQLISPQLDYPSATVNLQVPGVLKFSFDACLKKCDMTCLAPGVLLENPREILAIFHYRFT
jgi:hypothetical protein